MARTWEVGMLLAVWRDYDRALGDVSREDAVRQIDGGSAFAWTLGHVTQGVDSWINMRFQGFDPHPLTLDQRFGFGSDGRADDWENIQEAVIEIRSRAEDFLSGLEEADLDRVVPYDGSFTPFREHGIQLRPAIIQSAAHHQFHLGEIVTKRELLGYGAEGFPGVDWWDEFLMG